MKYTIMGFSQKAACEFNLDLIDLVILRWFVDFKDSGNMRCAIVDEEKYYWVFYEKIVEDICIMSIGKSAVYKRLKKMCDSQILKKKLLHYGGNYSYYALGENYVHLIRFQTDKKNTTSAQNSIDSIPDPNDFNYSLNDINHAIDNFNPEDSDLDNEGNDFNHDPIDMDKHIVDFSQYPLDKNPNVIDFSHNPLDKMPYPHDENDEQIINQLNKSNKLKTFDESSAEFLLAQLLFKLIKKNNHNFKTPDLKNWISAFELILHEDNRDFREVTELIKWIYLDDEFWSSLVLSPWDLRKQYDEILARKNYENGNFARI